MHTYPATLYLLSTNTRIIMRMPVHSYRCPPYRVDAGTLLPMPTLPRGCWHTPANAHLTAWMPVYSCRCPPYRVDAGFIQTAKTVSLLWKVQRLLQTTIANQATVTSPNPSTATPALLLHTVGATTRGVSFHPLQTTTEPPASNRTPPTIL